MPNALIKVASTDGSFGKGFAAAVKTDYKHTLLEFHVRGTVNGVELILQACTSQDRGKGKRPHTVLVSESLTPSLAREMGGLLLDAAVTAEAAAQEGK
jgi:hypothetical protein